MALLTIKELSVGHGNEIVISGLNGGFSTEGINLILGKTGSGKTSLLLTLAGFLSPISGGMSLENSIWEPQGRVGLAFQNPENLFFCPTVGEEVLFGLEQRDIAHTEAIVQAKKWLEKWGLDPEKFWEKNPLKLSGGEQRRVALASCTVFSPEMILLDEPFAGLDLKGRGILLDILRDLSGEKIVVVVSHEIEEILGATEKILLISEKTGYWFSGPGEFLKRSINDSQFFPLPEWYVKALEGFLPLESFPLPEPSAVSDFIENRFREESGN